MQYTGEKSMKKILSYISTGYRALFYMYNKSCKYGISCIFYYIYFKGSHHHQDFSRNVYVYLYGPINWQDYHICTRVETSKWQCYIMFNLLPLIWMYYAGYLSKKLCITHYLSCVPLAQLELISRGQMKDCVIDFKVFLYFWGKRGTKLIKGYLKPL